MNKRQITADEIERAIKQGRVYVVVSRRHKIALDGFPARPATNEAIKRAQREGQKLCRA